LRKYPDLDRREQLRRTYIPILTAICVVAAFILVQPLQAGAQKIPVLTGCRISLTPPTDATDMNTVINGSRVKTIHVEKEVFDCQVANSKYIADVTIYTA
jgi:hypothetical protein